MGKFGNSSIHNRYSDWHWQLVAQNDKYKRLYVADIDRLWLEYDFNKRAIVAAIDLKWEGSGDTMTATEKGVSEWFEDKHARYYIVYITHDFYQFRVVNCANKERVMGAIEYADWLLSLRNGNKDEGFHEHIEVEPMKAEVEQMELFQ